MTRPSAAGGALQTEWLGTFLAIAEHSGVRAASHALHLSPSRVSAHLTALERVVGVRLVDRGPRGTRLTSHGETFRAHARRAFAELDLGIRAARDSAMKARPRIGLCTPLPPTLLSRLVWLSGAEAPPPSFIELSVVQAGAALRDNTIDVAIAPSITLDSRLPHSLLHHETVLRVGSPAPGHPVFVRADDETLFRTTGIALPRDVHPVADLALAIALVHSGHGTVVAMRSSVPVNASVTAIAECGGIDFSLTWSQPPPWLADFESRARRAAVPDYETADSSFPRSAELTRT